MVDGIKPKCSPCCIYNWISKVDHIWERLNWRWERLFTIMARVILLSSIWMNGVASSLRCGGLARFTLDMVGIGMKMFLITLILLGERRH